MKIATITPSHICLGFDVTLTGGIDYLAGGLGVAAVEVTISGSCERLRTTGFEELPGPANALKRIWVRLEDLVDDSGCPVSNQDLIDEVKLVQERNKERQLREARHGLLGENWP